MLIKLLTQKPQYPEFQVDTMVVIDIKRAPFASGMEVRFFKDLVFNQSCVSFLELQILLEQAW